MSKLFSFALDLLWAIPSSAPVMATLAIAFGCLSVSAAASGQTQNLTEADSGRVTPQPIRRNDPLPAARAPAIAAGVGYAYLNFDMHSAGRINLMGLDGNLTMDIRPRLGLMMDVSYLRSPNVFNSGRHTDVLSYLAGPVFYPTRHKKLTTYVRALLGGTTVHGVVPLDSGGLAIGYTDRFSYAVGFGAEYRISPDMALRAGGDLLHSTFFSPDAQIRGQNNFRVVTGIVYFFGPPWHGRH